LPNRTVKVGKILIRYKLRNECFTLVRVPNPHDLRHCRVGTNSHNRILTHSIFYLDPLHFTAVEIVDVCALACVSNTLATH